MRKLLFAFLACALLFSGRSFADEQEAADRGNDIEKRLERLEELVKNGASTDELGHRLHPIHSMYGLKIGGGITLTAQGATHLKTRGAKAALALSGDVAMESPIGERGRAVAVFDFQQGDGLSNLPQFFMSPNGSPSGPNADIESFNNNALHLTQLYYEHNIDGKLVVSVGKLDPTAYFDANDFANNERSQFLANIFVNNPAIEFGGSPDFYSPGARATYSPTDAIGLTVAAFEGDGDFSSSFDRPFLFAEADFKAEPLGRAGNYRVYYWTRHGRPDALTSANPNDITLVSAKNSGAGLSVDQMLNDWCGVWLRFGAQDRKAAQFDRFAGAGINISGQRFGRENDSIGVGYGVSLMGKDYKDYVLSQSPTFREAAEHYIEAYYNFAVEHAPGNRGFHISPDIQYVVNSGGDKDAAKPFIYGVRMQAYF